MIGHMRLPQDNFNTQQFLHTWDFNTDWLRGFSIYVGVEPIHVSSYREVEEGYSIVLFYCTAAAALFAIVYAHSWTINVIFVENNFNVIITAVMVRI
jgi:hypothetical protein